jgi:hypothetical protein
VSLYREPGRERRRRRLVALAAAAVVALAVVAVVLLASGGGESRADRDAAARAAAARATERLDLLEIEYEQAVGSGSTSAPSELVGAQGHLDAARATLGDHAEDLRRIDARDLARAQRALGRLADLVAARKPMARVQPALAEARTALDALAG